MKQNTFYVLAGNVVTALVGIFWLSLEWNNPLPIQISFVAGIIFLYLAHRKVTGRIEDERSVLISQKAALNTLQIFWVVFFTFSLSMIVMSSSRLFGLERVQPIRFIREHQPHGFTPSNILFSPGFIQLLFLCIIIFLYVGFRFYYARKYGSGDADEE